MGNGVEGIEQVEPRLLAEATRVQGELRLREQFSSGSVGAALVTLAGNVYSGVCLDFASGLGFCAEHSAIAEMLKHRETDVRAIVAVGPEGILAPCGRCRELLAQVSAQNFATRIALPGGRTAPLSELLPNHWLAPRT